MRLFNVTTKSGLTLLVETALMVEAPPHMRWYAYLGEIDIGAPSVSAVDEQTAIRDLIDAYTEENIEKIEMRVKK